MHFFPQIHLIVFKTTASLAKWLCLSIHVRSITKLSWLAPMVIWGIRLLTVIPGLQPLNMHLEHNIYLC